MTCLKIAGLIAPLCALLAFGQHSRDGKLNEAPHTLRVDVDLVLLHASVTDRRNKFVNGLEKEHFRVWEDKIEQQIEYFSTESVPLSVGIIFDVSGSMEDKLTYARAAANTFLSMGDQDDEYFLVEFSDSARLVQDFTTDTSKLTSKLLFARAKGRTSLYDAMYLALDRVNRGKNVRKALLLITDGEDNRSRYSMSNIREFAREHDVMIYCIGIEDGFPLPITTLSGHAALESLAELTGGVAFFPRDVMALPNICEQIGLDLKNQYVLGYRSLNRSNDGKWRKIRVAVNRPKGLPAVSIRAKSGYYAPGIASLLK